VLRKPYIFRILLPILWAALMVSCGSTKNKDMEVVTYRVNSFRVPCEGVAPMECLEIRRGDSESWELFYSEIEGFEFEPGYLYRLRVREEKLDPSQVPADASSIKYTLVSVEEKVMDPKLRLNDIWMLQELEGREVWEEALSERLRRPYIEFHLADGRYMGSDGCNTFRGSLDSVGERELQLGLAMSTRMSCGDMTIPNAIMELLSRVDAYELREGQLILLEGNTELLEFRKTD
jgi:heat shock protein HslJ